MKKQIGTGPCLACGETIPYKLADSGALSVCCPWCDFSGYARSGTQARGVLESRMTRNAAPVAAPAAAPIAAPVPAPAPAPRKTSTIFG